VIFVQQTIIEKALCEAAQIAQREDYAFEMCCHPQLSLMQQRYLVAMKNDEDTTFCIDYTL